MAEEIATYIGATSIVSALGVGTAANMRAVWSGQSGIAMHADGNLFAEPMPLQLIGDEVYSLAHVSDDHTRLENLMIYAGCDVLAQSPARRGRTGIIISTTKGNVRHLAQALPEAESNVYLPVMARRVAKALGIDEEPIVVSNACISGVTAVVAARRLIRHGVYSHVLVIGGDEATRFVSSGFGAFKSLSSQPCRPYDSRRDGLTLGEAVAALLVTSQSDLSCGVTIDGGAASNDANHISGPSRTGDGLALAISRAMNEAQAQPSDIALVNAHGTATLYNDEMEAKALALAGLAGVPVNSLKPYFGHTLGASGVVEIIVCAQQLLAGKALPTLGFESLGVSVPLNVTTDIVPLTGNRCLKTASGFGGCNAAVVLSRNAVEVARQTTVLPKATTVRTCAIEDGSLIIDGNVTPFATDSLDDLLRSIYHQRGEANMKFFKMDRQCKLGYLAAAYLLDGTDFEPSEVAIVMHNYASSLDTDVRHNQILASGEPASPATFVYTLANIVTGEIAIRHKIMGETTFFVASGNAADHDFVQRYAQILMAENEYKYVICGWCEAAGDNYRASLALLSNINQ